MERQLELPFRKEIVSDNPSATEAREAIHQLLSNPSSCSSHGGFFSARQSRIARPGDCLHHRRATANVWQRLIRSITSRLWRMRDDPERSLEPGVRLPREGRVHRCQNSFVSEEKRAGCGVERTYRLARRSFLRQQLHNR